MSDQQEILNQILETEYENLDESAKKELQNLENNAENLLNTVSLTLKKL